MKIHAVAVLLLAATFVLSISAQAQAPKYPKCVDDETYQALDFWVGDWRVESEGGEFQGTNRIEKVQAGCGVKEFWTDGDGNPGFSLFYVMNGQWRQVWLTPYARVPGGVKEKHQVLEFEDEGIRFQGTITKADGSSYIDRTTLTPLPEGRVRQNIEFSQDEGENWQSVWDAIYVPVEASDEN